MQEQYDLVGQVIGLAMKVHSAMGAGYLEPVYKKALIVELLEVGLPFEEEKRLVVHYRGVEVGDFVADLIVANKLVLELIAVLCMVRAHEVQLVNYLTTTGIEDGLLLNFGATRLEYRHKYRTYLKH